MRFFAKQKVDQIGITAVTLQKILLFLMILSLFTVFNGGFFSFLLCLIGFIGAYRRSPGMLAAYVSISVVLIVLCSIVAIGSIFMVTSDDYVYEFSSSGSSVGGFQDYNQGRMSKIQQLVRSLSAIGSDSTAMSSSSESHNSVGMSSDSIMSSPPNTNSVYTDSNSFSEGFDATGMIFLLVIVMVLAFFLAYLKIYSLVLSWRLRKMILSTATALPTTTAPQTHEFEPVNTSCAVPEEMPAAPVSPFQHAPVFAPGFAPYPYPMHPMMMPPHMQGQYPGQFPHHVMFGQQPVFYSYGAPVNQPTEEKM